MVRLACWLLASFALGNSTARADLLSELPEKLFSQCGLVSLILFAGVVYFAGTTAKARTGWTDDRAGMMTIIRSQDESVNKLSVAYAKLEAILLATIQRRQ